MSTRRLTAVMFTDIVGYTAMMQADEASSMAKVSRFREVVAQYIEAHQGKLIEIRGDGSLSIFSSATEAVACAKHIQESLREDIPLRIGIHSGDVIERDGQIFGDAVNIASRIESLGVPGAVLASSNIAKQIKNKADFEMASLGKFHFKNVDEPMEIFALANEGFVVPKRSEVQGKLKQSAPSYLKWAIPIAALVIIALLVTQSFWGNQQTVREETAAEKTLSIAVLPFRDLSPNGDQEYFSDGVSEELLNVLTKVNKLKVASRTSSFVFKREDRNIQDIAEILEVDYVLEGSVRKSEEQLRITAQLIDAETDRHIWSETYDRQLDDIFALQDELAGAIVKEVNGLLGNRKETNSLQISFSTDNLDAYELYLKSKNVSGNEGIEKNWKILALLEEAVEKDSLFTDALAELAYFYSYQASWVKLNQNNHTLASQLFNKSQKINKKALRVNPENGLALINEANFLVSSPAGDKNWELALKKFQVLIDKGIKNYEIHYSLGCIYLILGYFDHAIYQYNEAFKLKNDHPNCHLFIAISYAATKQYKKAIHHYAKAHLFGTFLANEDLIYIFKALGRFDEIDMILPDLVPDSLSIITPYLRDVILADESSKKEQTNKFWSIVKEVGIEKERISNLNVGKCFLEEFGSLEKDKKYLAIGLTFVWRPSLQDYRKTEWFKIYLRESNVVSYWQKYGFPPQCRDLGNGDFECD